MYCENCGKKLEDHEIICRECGYRLTKRIIDKSNSQKQIKKNKLQGRYVRRIGLIIIGILSLMVFLFAVCGCKHEWVAATCDTPKTCSLCEKSEGTPLGHTWFAATCETPKKCKICSVLSGEALGHNWIEATTEKPKTCATCGKTEGKTLLVDFEDSISCIGMKSILRDTLAGLDPYFEYDDSGIFYVHLDAPDGTLMALLLSMDEIANDWESLTESMCSISKDAAECFAMDGYDVSCSVMLHSDLDPNKIIFATYNGMVVVDAMEELQ